MSTTSSLDQGTQGPALKPMLTDPGLYEWEFGRQAVRMNALRHWCAEKGHVLPQTLPDLAGFEAASIEALLAAIQRGVETQFHVDKIRAAQPPTFPGGASLPLPSFARRLAENIIDAARSLDLEDMRPKVREMIVEDGDWVVALREIGSSRAFRWRLLLGEALRAGELGTVDAESGAAITEPLRDLGTVGGRLAKLKEMGGTATMKSGYWRFTKIDDLAAYLRERGVSPHSSKTLREEFVQEMAGHGAPTAAARWYGTL